MIGFSFRNEIPGKIYREVIKKWLMLQGACTPKLRGKSMS
jgi:hypothetical protein